MLRKKWIAYSAIILVVLVLVYLLVNILKGINESEKIAQSLDLLPALEASRIDGNDFSSSHLSQEKPVLLFLFEPDCGYCQKEGLMLEKDQRLLTNVEVIMLSSAPVQHIEQFALKYNLQELPNFHFVHQQEADIAQTFGPVVLPTIYIYDQNKILIQKVEGMASTLYLMEKLAASVG